MTAGALQLLPNTCLLHISWPPALQGTCYLFFVSLSFIFTTFLLDQASPAWLFTRKCYTSFWHLSIAMSSQALRRKTCVANSVSKKTAKFSWDCGTQGSEGFKSWRWLWLCVVLLGFAGIAVVSWDVCGFMVLTGRHSCGFVAVGLIWMLGWNGSAVRCSLALHQLRCFL